ncbi:EamA family transporter [Novosphingobium sp. FGD1]|jgi:drug/metabolite transporter (DMT)-like permease|uniref:EamA family transporter n=3 Tax=Sphingomonadaceae TaxID=41297 RepID=A0A7X4GI78_9SPHN|nr:MULTISPECIES: DMT family transporter [Sphingomonadaceae]MCC4254828.1 DMT family transporter [Sphingobium naphthae]KEZ16594.1 hypothetical protein CP98_04022 [Sphingobium yanoikuyae]MDG5973195.1 hypothetical protein [Sphingomonas paucimobilis]MDK8186625.1 DMT family transporter [Sphingomonas zeae]MDK8216280.1 DMT family transporter [Sphingomonas sp. UMB7805-LC452B]
MNARKAIDGKALIYMIGLCAIWGMQQTAVKLAAPAMPEILQVALRSGVALVVIAGIAAVRRETGWFFKGTWKAGLVIGLLFGLEYFLVTQGLRFTTASHISIFLYTSPIFAALGLHMRLPEERLDAAQWVGIAVAFLGIVFAFAGRAGGVRIDTGLIGDALGIAAGAAWGLTTIALRLSALSNAPTTITVSYQLAGAFFLLTILSFVLGQVSLTATPILIASMAFQIIMVGLLSFLLWFSLLRRYLASQLGVLSFMTPIFGITFGALILNDPLDGGFIAGAVLVLTGIFLVGGRDLFRKTSAATP